MTDFEAPLTTVVVPVHNAATTLAQQLEALAEQETDRSFEVLVVDNNSTDDSAAIATTYTGRIPRLRIIPATRGASVAYARNAGTREALGSRVLYCDADDVVRPGWLDAMIAAMDTHDIVGGRLDVTRLNSAVSQSWVGEPPRDSLASAMKYRPYTTGGNMGVRIATWIALGGFDETFVGGHEEVDFCWRAIDRGFTQAFVPNAVVDYRLRETRRGVMRQRFGYGRTYAQLYSRFRSHPIPRCSLKHEVKVVVGFLAEGWREWRTGNLTRWLAGLAWTAGRYRGDLAHRVRCPL